MAINLFSKRKKQRESQGKSDVYQYDVIPEPFRIQVAHIWRAALGQWYRDQYGFSRSFPSSQLWEHIQKTGA